MTTAEHQSNKKEKKLFKNLNLQNFVAELYRNDL